MPEFVPARIDRRDRPALLAEAPHLYYAPDHYSGYDGVLIRLAHCTPELPMTSSPWPTSSPRAGPANAKRYPLPFLISVT